MSDNARQRSATPAMETESREWLIRCPVCGHEPSVWDLGGIRYKASGTKWIFRRCSACNQVGWHLVYRKRDGITPPALRPARPLRWYIGALAAIIVIFVALLGGTLFVILSRASAGPREATNGYFAAGIAQDWAGAHGRLSAMQRGQVSTGGLAAIWAAREGTRGPAESFRVTNFNIRNGQARISGTLRYRDGTTESRTVWLIEEGGAWKITAGH